MSVPRKIRCVVDRVVAHGDGVYTVGLKPEQPVPVFRAGQFLHLTVEEYDPSAFWPESRVFSIASPAGDRTTLRISYSVKGVYTRRMEQELKPGRRVWVKLPYGEFVIDPGQDAVLIAGGTGITAFQSFLGNLTPAHGHGVLLLYGARRPALLLGLDDWERLRREVPRFRAFYFAEESAGAPPGCTAGRVQLERLDDCEPGSAAIYYVAGPPGMLASVRTGLMGRGIPAGRIRVDAWE